MCAAVWGAAARYQISGQILCGTLMYSGRVTTTTTQWHLFRFSFACPNKPLTFALKMPSPRYNWTRRYDFYVGADAWYHSWSVRASEANRFFTPIPNNKKAKFWEAPLIFLNAQFTDGEPLTADCTLRAPFIPFILCISSKRCAVVSCRAARCVARGLPCRCCHAPAAGIASV